MIQKEVYHSDCSALQLLFDEVFSAIPAPDREKIEQVCEIVEFCTDPNMPGDSQPFAAALYDGRIIVDVDRMLAMSLPEQRAVLAHELGHARDRYDNPITARNAGRDKERRRAEASANGYASRWGFKDDLGLLYGCEPTDYDPDSN